MNIKHEIETLAFSNGWANYEIIHFSNLKKTAVLLVKNSEGGIIIKTCFADKTENSRLEFNKELLCYQSFSELNFVPDVKFSGSDYFGLNYIQGGTIYENLFNNQEMDQEREPFNYIVSIASMISEFNGTKSEHKTSTSALIITKDIVRLLKVLLLCGPKGTNHEILRYPVLKVLDVMLKPFVFVFFYKKIQMLLKKGFPFGIRFHGDMHMNNLLKDNVGKLHLIDFECIEKRPGMLVDALYAYTTYYALSDLSAQDESDFKRGVFSDSFDEAELNYFFKVMTSAVNINRRFGRRGNLKNTLTFVFAIFHVIDK